MLVTPAAPRHTLQDLGDTLQITIPAPQNWQTLAFMMFWIVFASACGGLVTVSTIFEFKPERLVFLLGWWAGVIFAAANILWMFGGKEIISVSSEAITYRRQVLGVSFPKRYAIEHVKDLRVLPTVAHRTEFNWARQTSDSSGFWEGLLAFDYGAKTIRMASGIDEAEGKQILSTIQQRFPQYRQRASASQH